MKPLQISRLYRSHKDNLKQFVKFMSGKKGQNCIVFPPLLLNFTQDVIADPWLSNGFLVENDGQLILVDPGMGFYDRFTYTGYLIADVNHVFVSHMHLDHYAGLLPFIDKLDKRKTPYTIDIKLKDEFTQYFSDKIKQHKKNILSTTPLIHGVENRGFILGKIGYISDTGYSENIKNFFKNTEVCVVNINDVAKNRHSETHLWGAAVKKIFKNSKLKLLILTHINPHSPINGNNHAHYIEYFSDQDYKTICIPKNGQIIYY